MNRLRNISSFRDRGFTLIEVLISLAITAVITSLLYGTFRATLETSEGMETQSNTFRIARVVFHQLAKDMSMIRPTSRSPTGIQTPVALGEEPPLGSLPVKGEDQVRLAEGSVYPSDTLQFTSLAYQPVRKGLPISGLSEISYSLSEDALMRKARFREKEIENEVGEAILGWNIRYFDGKEKKWIDEWLPETTKDLPKAIEIELIFKVSSLLPPTESSLESPIEERRFKTTVEIPSSETL